MRKICTVLGDRKWRHKGSADTGVARTFGRNGKLQTSTIRRERPCRLTDMAAVKISRRRT
jgi:hypothetical protein